ncbi:hypothetical protein AB0J25_11545 [Streptomyces sp. NPDC049910]|uniref:hypothetical protein n=1 Tax=Streptomyces sp. NPDC049910 TaxID=3155278 RepID=UPI003436BB05
MKIAKLAKIAAGGLAVLVLSVNFTPGTGDTPERSAVSSASTQPGTPSDVIDWP